MAKALLTSVEILLINWLVTTTVRLMTQVKIFLHYLITSTTHRTAEFFGGQEMRVKLETRSELAPGFAWI